MLMKASYRKEGLILQNKFDIQRTVHRDIFLQ